MQALIMMTIMSMKMNVLWGIVNIIHLVTVIMATLIHEIEIDIHDMHEDTTVHMNDDIIIVHICNIITLATIIDTIDIATLDINLIQGIIKII